MKDVQRIFSALRNAATCIIAVGGILILECVWRNYDWKRMLLKASALGGGMLLLLLLIPVVWALIDFESAFLAMHQAQFTNDLWLLDPDTDLMIRMLPERFFVRFAGDLAIRCALWALAVPFCTSRYRHVPVS
jgi:integral membrane protein (TIGR01906 family)